jgi:serine/threonine-protein kinase
MRHELPAGSVFGGYRIEGKLGQGGMGIVYRARQISLDRPIALKVLTPDLAFDEASRKRFLQEGILAARVQHPQLVRVLQVGEQEHRLFLAFELVQGKTLRDRLHREGPLPVQLSVDIVLACADALATLHDAGILHRDIKPENIFLSVDRGPLIGDLGIAKDLAAEGLVKTRKGFVMGTPAYLAPETIVGKPAGPASDLYALGVVLFECLAGEPPFGGSEPQAILKQQVKSPVPLLASRGQGVPPELDRILARCLAKAPEDRFADAREFISALRHLAHDQTLLEATAIRADSVAAREAAREVARHATRVPRPKASTRSGRRTSAAVRDRSVMTGLGVALLATVLAGALLLQARGSAPRPPVPPVVRTPPVATEPSPQERRKKLLERAREAADTAGRTLETLRAEAERGHVQDLRDPASLSTPVLLERIFSIWKKAQKAIMEALPAAAALARESGPEGPVLAGELLARFFLLTEHIRVLSWDAMTAQASLKTASFALIGSFSLEFKVAGVMERLSADAVRFQGQVPPILAQSRDPVWRTGWLALRALSRYELKGKAIDTLHKEIVDNALALTPRIRLPDPPSPLDLKLASTALRTLIFMGAFDAVERLTSSWLAPVSSAGAGEPVMAPAAELAFFEAAQTRNRLLLAALLTSADRLQKHEAQFRAWVTLRDRLITRWPRDPDAGSSDPLDRELAWRLLQARVWLRICGRRAELQVPSEPRRGRSRE